MLQQTQVATVLPYYERFLKKFPNVRSLAKARESEVLRLWAGLGYYSRARNLHRAAKEIVSRHDGRVPGEYDQILELPGIGRYTAGAILSIAFQKPYPVLDGNVMRVFARYFGVRGDIKSAKVQVCFWKFAERLVHPARPGDWNQALMELGATVCLPDSPRCGSCPLETTCVARREGSQHRLPQSRAGKKPVRLRWTCLWNERDGKVLLHKRPDHERFLPGHWGLPESRHLITVKAGPLLATARHTITHHQIRLELRRVMSAPSDCPPGFRWVPRDQLDRFLISSAFRKFLDTIPAPDHRALSSSHEVPPHIGRQASTELGSR